MEENRKRPGCDEIGETEAKRRSPATSDDTESNEDDDWLSIDAETINELTKLLEMTSPVKVRFVDYPYSSPLIFQSSYVTINGNEESCGSSFSDSESSVMASVDMGAVNIGPVEAFSGWFPSVEGGAWISDDEVARGAVEENVHQAFSIKGMSGSDCCYYDDDDYMLARFLGENICESSE
ncbi:uncharacterized protein LOC132279138 [Cornus florida]|uniref:uncharacterized protein LOC132279138 n=1 Tax=Cornus florida TaxID=4283 RepID=UPI00289D48B0|nr:uncharacterized protein LOC132279138 [Cornus florida]